MVVNSTTIEQHSAALPYRALHRHWLAHPLAAPCPILILARHPGSFCASVPSLPQAAAEGSNGGGEDGLVVDAVFVGVGVVLPLLGPHLAALLPLHVKLRRSFFDLVVRYVRIP